MLSHKEEQQLVNLKYSLKERNAPWLPRESALWLIQKLEEVNNELKTTNELLTAVRTDKERVVKQLKKAKIEIEQVWNTFT